MRLKIVAYNFLTHDEKNFVRWKIFLFESVSEHFLKPTFLGLKKGPKWRPRPFLGGGPPQNGQKRGLGPPLTKRHAHMPCGPGYSRPAWEGGGPPLEGGGQKWPKNDNFGPRESIVFLLAKNVKNVFVKNKFFQLIQIFYHGMKKIFNSGINKPAMQKTFFW